MFTQTKRHLTGLLVFSALTLLGQSAHALVGTAPNTSVVNTVAVDYQVNAIAQPTVSTANGCTTCSVNFVVDRKIDLSIAMLVNNTAVTPNQLNAAVTYQITNEGNAPQRYAFNALNRTDDTAAGVMGALEIYIDDGDNVFDAGDTLLAANTTNGVNISTTLVVHVVGDVPSTPTNGQTFFVDLVATTLNTDNTAATQDGNAVVWTPGTVQTLFAEGAAGPANAAASGGAGTDAANDGKQSATGTYVVTTAALVVTKTQAVTADGVSVSNFKAIPGATIRYTITVQNTGAVSATNLSVVDDYDQATVSYNAASTTIQITPAGAPTALADNAVTAGTTHANNGNTLTVSGFTVPNGQTATIIFTATIL